MHRLFVAVDIPESAKDQLSRMSFGLPGARWIDKEQLHLTLRFIGEVDGGTFLDIRESLESVRLEPFDIQLKGIGYFPPRKSPRVLWVGVEKSDSLLMLRNRVESVLVKTGLPPEGRKYSPHITIARLKNTHSSKVGNFISINSLYESEQFQVNEFYLYSSTLTSKGAIHTIEAAYPLEK